MCAPSLKYLYNTALKYAVHSCPTHTNPSIPGPHHGELTCCPPCYGCTEAICSDHVLLFFTAHLIARQRVGLRKPPALRREQTQFDGVVRYHAVSGKKMYNNKPRGKKGSGSNICLFDGGEKIYTGIPTLPL